MLAAPQLSQKVPLVNKPPPPDVYNEEEVAQFADNFAVILYVLCRCPLNDMKRIVETKDWAQLTLKAVPARELRMFLRELFYTLNYSPSTAAIALLYIYEYFCRLDADAGFPTDLRFIVAALVLSNKFHDDCRISLKKWSRLCNVSVADITDFELTILKSLNWNLHVSVETFYWWGQIMFNLLHIRRQGDL